METRNIEKISMINIKIHKVDPKEDERKYAYEKAIEAYWKHVDRYHTWMNYYAIFNGALFVGFCTLYTATSYIYDFEKYHLFNNWNNDLYLILSILGFIASICWYSSILGHERWETNWINIIEFYEDRKWKVYKMLMVDLKDMKIQNDICLSKHHKDTLTDTDNFKAFSTHSITKVFVFFITMSWLFLFLMVNDLLLKHWCIYLIAIFVIIILYLLLDKLLPKLSTKLGIKYSNVKGKYWQKN